MHTNGIASLVQTHSPSPYWTFDEEVLSKQRVFGRRHFFVPAYEGKGSVNNDQQHMAIASLAAEMAAHGNDRDDPAREVMGLLGDRWSALILLVLATGEWRHAELRRTLAELSAEQAISQRVLTLKLRTLERDGFVARFVTNDVPPRVSYRLTGLGSELHCETKALINWINARAHSIRAARAEFDEARDSD